MKLLFNPNSKEYEFHTKREEREASNGNGGGVLGLALGTNARFKVTRWIGRDPVFTTRDAVKAFQLARFADEALRAQLQEAIGSAGIGIPTMTFRNNVYVWSGPQVSADGMIVYKEIPKKAQFAFAREPRTLPRGAGDVFDQPVWWTEQATKAAQCAEYADDVAALAIGRHMAKRHNALQASRAEDSDIEIPIPDGLTPYGFQRAGVAYAKPRKRVLFGDEMGLGKTIQACLWINLFPEIKRVLVVCPKTPKRWWLKAMQQWLVRPTTIGVADSEYSQTIPDTDIVIINYAMLARKVDTGNRTIDEKTGRSKIVYEYHLRESLRIKWDMLIVDECHKLKGNPKDVIRSRMVYSIQAERMAFLSGTPMVNRPSDLWFIVHHLAPKAFPSKAQFMHRYCRGGKNPRDPNSGASNLAELQEKLRLWIMVRRLTQDVLKDLPPKRRQVIELPVDGATAAMVKQERLAYERKADMLAEMRLRVELAKASDSAEDYRKAVSTLTRGIQVAFEDLSRVRKETALAKVPAVIEHVASVLSEGHKVILFCHHKEVVAKYYEAFRSEAVTLTGDTKERDRNRAMQLFQEDPRVRLFIGTMGAAGESITLTAASYEIFAELDYVPGTVKQAENRAYRIGLLGSLLIQHLVAEGSIDKRMADILVEKQDIADKTLDRDEADAILNEPITPDAEAVATQGVTQKEIARLAETITATDIAAVHMGLRLLAGTHRDSGLIEGATFREVDAPLGRALADHKRLTPKMAALGKRFLSRYRNTTLAIIPEIQELFSRTSRLEKVIDRMESS